MKLLRKILLAITLAALSGQALGSPPAIPPTTVTLKETIGAKLRRLSKEADATNPLTRGVMVSPPTITNSGTHLSTLTQNISAPMTGVVRYIGTSPSGGGYVESIPSAAGSYLTGSWGWEIDTDAPQIEFNSTYNSGFYGRLLVDGVLSSLSFTNIATGGSTLIDFTSAGGRQLRRIRWEWGSSGATLAHIYVGPYDVIKYPSTQDSILAVFAGDSVTAGTGSTYSFQTFVQQTAKKLGWDNPWASGIAATGYQAASSHSNLPTRLATDVIALNPDVVVVPMGVNDLSYTTASETAAVTSTIAALRAGLPNAIIFVVGPWATTPGSYSYAAQQTFSAAIGAGVSAGDPAGVVGHKTFFIDNIAAQWITSGSTGTDTSPQSNGNADWYISGSAGWPHPNEAGHNYYGLMLPEAIKSLLPLIP